MSDIIGVIGTGTMGGAIARRLLARGFHLLVHDSRQSAMEPLQALGASLASDVAAVAEAADIIIASLPSPEISIEVARQVATGRRVRTYIETSTIGREAIQRVASQLGPSISVLDAPVSGGAFAAAEGTLAMFVAGPSGAIATSKHVLDALASKVFDLGDDVGKGQLCKIINNGVGMAGMVAACEGLAFARRAGIPAQMMLDVFNSGSAANWATLKFLPNTLLAGKPAGPIAITSKDTGLYLAEAASLGAATPVTSSLHDRLEEIVAHGDPQRDTTAIYSYFIEIADRKHH